MDRDAICRACGSGLAGIICSSCRTLATHELAGRDLTAIPLGGVDLRRANLKDAVLRDADLSHADLRGANLDGVDVKGANLEGAKIDARYNVLLTGKRLKGYSGSPAWQTTPSGDPNSPGKWAVKGHDVRCPCCGGETFVLGRSVLESRSLAFFDLEWLADGAALLTCTVCTRVEWFRSEPTPRL